MKKRIIYGIAFAYLIVGWIGLTHAQNESFHAYVHKDKIGVNERFQLVFEGKNLPLNTIEYPSLSGFNLIYGPNTSEQRSMTFSNNQAVTTSVFKHEFVLSPQRTGSFEIGSAQITVNGKTYKTDPITITVSKSASASASSSGQNDTGGVSKAELDRELRKKIFLRASVSKSTIYLGEQFTVSYRLYLDEQLFRERKIGREYNVEEPPEYEGFWPYPVNLKNQQASLEVVNGKKFYVQLIRRDVLIPQKAGEFKLSPNKISINVALPRQNSSRKRSDPNDPFSQFEEFFNSTVNRYRTYKHIMANPQLAINVKPLPSNYRPRDFSGYVGEIDLNVKMEKTEIETGEAATLRLQFKGRGNLHNLKAPEIDVPGVMEIYDPKVSEQIGTAGGSLNGYKTFDYLIIPRSPGEFEIPAINFSYFDDNKKQYQTINSDAIPIKVTGEAQEVTTNAGVVNKEDVMLIGEDIRYIQTSNIDLDEKGKSFAGSVGFWLLYSLPLFLFVGLYVWKNKRDEAAADVQGTRFRKATKLARKRLSAAKTHMEKKEEKAFYDEVVRTLWGYLSDKLSLRNAELSREHISEQLQEREVNPAYIERVTELLDTCEMALFAPTAISGGMEETYVQAIQLIADIEKEV